MCNQLIIECDALLQERVINNYKKYERFGTDTVEDLYKEIFQDKELQSKYIRQYREPREFGEKLVEQLCNNVFHYDIKHLDQKLNPEFTSKSKQIRLSEQMKNLSTEDRDRVLKEFSRETVILTHNFRTIVVHNFRRI